MSAVTEQELAAKAVAPRVTPADIEAQIAAEHHFKVAQALTALQHPVSDGLNQLSICVLMLRNGTKIIGVNEGPVSPENFDPEIGQRYAREAAVRQVWPLLGYQLRNDLMRQAKA